jgi:AcrR family transcriptional regulator
LELLNTSKRCTLIAMAKVHLRKTPVPQPRGDAFVQIVLDSALAQLAEVGLERLTIPQVAELAGVNKTSVYRRWPSKENLVQDALQAAMRHTDQAPDTGELRADLMALAKTVATFTQSNVGMAMVRVMLSQGGDQPLRALATSAYSEAGRQGPWAVLARAAQRGELKKTVDPSLVLFTIAGAIMHRVFVEQRAATNDFIQQVVDLVLAGAATEP